MLSETAKKVWLDTATIAQMVDVDVRKVIDSAVAEGYIFVIEDAIVDVYVFQENVEWLKELLAAGKIIIDIAELPEPLNARNNRESACQHYCGYFLNADGSINEI